MNHERTDDEGYSPYHPWHYRQDGDGHAPYPLEDIPPRIDRSLFAPAKLPVGPKRLAKLQELLARARQRLVDSERHYADVVAGKVTREVWEDDEDEAVLWAQNLAAAVVGVRNDRGRVAVLNQLIEETEAMAATTKTKTESGKRKAERPRVSGLTANGIRHLPPATIDTIPVEEIYRSPFQTREFDPIDNPDIHRLAETIKNHGLLQPIVVRLVGDHYELIAGERRLRACRVAKIDRIPAKIVDVDDRDAAALCAIENLQRKDLNPIERARSIKTLAGLGQKQSEIGKALGLSQSAVANELRLLKLPAEWQQRIISGEISARHGRALVSYLKDERIMAAATDWLGAHPENVRVEQFETWLGMLKSGNGKAENGNGEEHENAKARNGDGKAESQVPSPEPRDSSPESRVPNPRALDRQLDDEDRAEKRWNNDIEALEARLCGLMNAYGDDADYMQQLGDTLATYSKSCLAASKKMRKGRK